MGEEREAEKKSGRKEKRGGMRKGWGRRKEKGRRRVGLRGGRGEGEEE